MNFATIIPTAFSEAVQGTHALPVLERETLASDMFVDDRRIRDRWTWAMTFATAATLHIGLLAAATTSRIDRVGAAGVDGEAVSIEVSIISVGALESRAPDREKASGAVGRVDIRDGTAEPKQSAAEATASTLEKKALEQPTDDDFTLPVKIAMAEPVQATSASEASPVAPAGGQAAHALSNVLPTPASGAAAASVGEVQAYAASVVETLAKSRPRAAVGMETGTVLVAFEIDATGAPANVRVSKSSGKPRIDRLVIDAIQATIFTSPPAHASLAQRSYELPYVFR